MKLPRFLKTVAGNNLLKHHLLNGFSQRVENIAVPPQFLLRNNAKVTRFAGKWPKIRTLLALLRLRVQLKFQRDLLLPY